MRFGIAAYPTDEGSPIVALARAVEERGFESIFVPEHTHIPADGASTPTRGGGTRRASYRLMEPFTALAAVAAATSRIRLATGVILLAGRDVIATAKQIASVDHLSGGRLMVGVGPGWNREELENHGVRFEARWSILEEKLAAMREIWANDVAAFSGEHVRFTALHQWPKPRQRPHPPVLLADNRASPARAVVEHADGWLPHLGTRGRPFPVKVQQFRAECDELGAAGVPITAHGAEPTAGAIEELQACGVHRCVFRLPAEASLDGSKRYLDGLHQLITGAVGPGALATA